MNIVQLFTLIGHRNLHYQVLHKAVTKGRSLKRSSMTEVTFITSENLNSIGVIGEPRRIGFIVWADADRVDIAHNTPMPKYELRHLDDGTQWPFKDGIEMTPEQIIAALNEG